jgi:hypothetical protein
LLAAPSDDGIDATHGRAVVHGVYPEDAFCDGWAGVDASGEAMDGDTDVLGVAGGERPEGAGNAAVIPGEAGMEVERIRGSAARVSPRMTEVP